MKKTTASIGVLVVFCAMTMVIGCTFETMDDASKPIQISSTSVEFSKDKKPTVAFVTNGIAAFWTVAEVGAMAAEKDLNAEVLVRMPQDAADQKRILEELINQQVDGVAISPINSENQSDLLERVARSTKLITHDADAPEVKGRHAYIGMDNYTAGQMCGRLVQQAMPEGGEVMIFVGRLGQLNADLRRQGLIDELLNREDDRSRRDPTGVVLKSPKSIYVVVDTKVDDFNPAQSKSQAEDAIVGYENLGCMVGLFSYNPPAILEALARTNKLGKIKVVAFDEEFPTLQAIQDGTCAGTVVQDPYNYGYQSVELLTKLARGDRSMVPTNPDKFIDLPARIIHKDNVGPFWDQLKQRLGVKGSESSGS